jgi:PBP1b-binding outer membrane lipoprotein LpoB
MNAIFISAIKFASILATSIIIAGCASSNTKVESRIQVAKVPDFSKMFIAFNVESRFFNKDIASGLQQSLLTSLASCGVVAEVYVKDPLDLKPQQTFIDKMKVFNPDSLLSVVRTGGNVVIGQGGNNAKFDVTLRLYKTNPRQEVWTAKSDVSILTENLFVNDVKSGEKMGLGFFEIMKKDGLICKG